MHAWIWCSEFLPGLWLWFLVCCGVPVAPVVVRGVEEPLFGRGCWEAAR